MSPVSPVVEVPIGAPSGKGARDPGWDRSGRRQGRAAPELVIALGVLCIFISALLHAYGLKDDYTLLSSAHGYAHAGMGEPGISIRLGRPLFGLLTIGLYDLLPGVNALWIARAVSIGGIALFAIVLYRALAPAVVARWSAVLISLLVVSLPPFLVYAGWATLFCAPYAAAFAGISALLAAASAGAPIRRQRARLLLSGLLFVLALAMYQPTAMAFWVVAFIAVLGRRHSAEAVEQVVRRVALIGVPCMFGAYLTLKIGVWTLGAAGPTRAGLTTDVLAKLRWIPEPMGLALSLFATPPSIAVAALVAVLAVMGAFLYLGDLERGTRDMLIALAAIAVPLSLAPNLLAQEDYATYRIAGPLAGVFALLVSLLFVSAMRARPTALRLAGTVGLVLFATGSVVLGYRHLRDLMVLPLSREWQIIHRQAATIPRQATEVGFIAPTFDGGPIKTKYGVRDELGVPSSASTWADPAMIWLALRSGGRDPSRTLRVRVQVQTPVESSSSPPWLIPYIDLAYPLSHTS